MSALALRRVTVAVTIAAALLVAPYAFAQGTPPAATGKVDINTASQAALESLPGIGPATAKKIIAGRPYAAVDDLKKAGVSARVIEKITPLVTVSSAAPAPAPKPTAPATAPTPRTTVPPPAASPKTETAPTTAQQPPVKGMVWVNTATKVYHREGDRWYGKTKQGKFMTEEDAIKAGYRAAKEPAAGKK